MSSYTKYIIEIADEPVNGRYSVKGFTSFAFTEESLKKLKKLNERGDDKWYCYVTDNFEICYELDSGSETDFMRKEVGNYYLSREKAEHVRDRMLEFLGRGAKDDVL